jgi:hypothetical protein
MLVEDIEKAVGEAPEKEEGDDECQRENESPAFQVAASKLRSSGGNCASHCDDG